MSILTDLGFHRCLTTNVIKISLKLVAFPRLAGSVGQFQPQTFVRLDRTPNLPRTRRYPDRPSWPPDRSAFEQGVTENKKTRARDQLDLIHKITATLAEGSRRGWLFGGWGLDARIG